MRNVVVLLCIILMLCMLGGCAIPVDTPEDGVWTCTELNMCMDMTSHFAIASDGTRYRLNNTAIRYNKDGTCEEFFFIILHGGWVSFSYENGAYLDGALNGSLQYKEGADQFTLKVSRKEKYVFVRQVDDAQAKAAA